MATKSRSKTRRMGSSTSSAGRSRTGGRGGSRSRSREESGSSGRGIKGRMRGAMRSAAQSGVHVKAEMADPKVARIVIEIDWEELVSRVAKKMGRGIKKRVARRAGRTRRASASAS